MINPKRTVQEYILGSMQVLQFTANPYEKNKSPFGLGDLQTPWFDAMAAQPAESNIGGWSGKEVHINVL